MTTCGEVMKHGNVRFGVSCVLQKGHEGEHEYFRPLQPREFERVHMARWCTAFDTGPQGITKACALGDGHEGPHNFSSRVRRA